MNITELPPEYLYVCVNGHPAIRPVQLPHTVPNKPETLRNYPGCPHVVASCDCEDSQHLRLCGAVILDRSVMEAGGLPVCLASYDTRHTYLGFTRDML